MRQYLERPARCSCRLTFVCCFLILAIAPLALADGGVPYLGKLHGLNRRPSTQRWDYNRHLRNLEDAGNYEGSGENGNDDNGNYRDTIMAIEQDVEATLKDMFYNAPSEWTGRHWAFFSGIVAIVLLVLCWFCACFIPCCCCPGGDSKPLVVKTEEEHNRYTNDLMTEQNNAIDYQYTEEGNATLEHAEESESDFHDEYESDFTGTDSNFDSMASTDVESFHNESEEKSDYEDYEYTNSNGYYKYSGPNRRQLT